MVVENQTSHQTKKDILAPIRPDMARLNDVVRTTLHSEVPLVNQVAEYLINAGGKRLRPAIHLLLNPDLSLEDVAQHVGFSETSTFHRAFKKWTGVTPGLYRQLHGHLAEE